MIVAEGWNSVGAISLPLSINHIISMNPGIIMGGFWEYVGTYKAADNLKPGRGYWVKCTQSGSLVISQ